MNSAIGQPLSSHVGVAPATRAVASAGLVVLGVAVSCYLAFGKGFAHFGVPPVFVGEVLLVVLLAVAIRPTMRLPTTAPAMLTYGLLALGLLQLAVDLTGPQAAPALESLRGFAVIYYAGFAVVAFALLRRQEAVAGRVAVLDLLDAWLRRSAWFVIPVVFIIAFRLVVDLPALFLDALIQGAELPNWPSGVPVILTKPTDISVALVVFMPVVFSDIGRRARTNGQVVLLALWLTSALLVATRSRGALLALGFGGLLVFQQRLRASIRVAGAAFFLLLLLFLTGLRMDVGVRELSFEGLTSSVASLASSSDDFDDGADTARWRSAWWSDIWSDVEGQPMVLHGWGWGDNLAVRYGVVQPEDADDPLVLRLPHSIFFSLAGRAGLVTAFGFLAVVALSVTATRRRRLGPDGGRVSVRGARGGLVAAVVIGLTDVFVESPQGAIVLWASCGVLWWVAASARSPERPELEVVEDGVEGDAAQAITSA